MKSHRIAAAAAAIALAATPAALAKKPADAGAKGKEKSELKGQNGKAKGKAKAKAKSVVLKGTVVSADATHVEVLVTKANKHGRWLISETPVSFTITKVSVADVNGDGIANGDDIQDGDKVVVQARLAKDAQGPFAARKVVDQTHPAEDDEEAEDAPAQPVVTEPAPTEPAPVVDPAPVPPTA